jgi:2-oxoglutarate dehydrogenase complex dehydrogenase (E1) component-like enzyme
MQQQGKLLPYLSSSIFHPLSSILYPRASSREEDKTTKIHTISGRKPDIFYFLKPRWIIKISRQDISLRLIEQVIPFPLKTCCDQLRAKKSFSAARAVITRSTL